MCVCVHAFIYIHLCHCLIYSCFYSNLLCINGLRTHKPFWCFAPRKPESLVFAAYKASLRYSTDVKAFLLCLIAVTLVVLKTRLFLCCPFTCIFKAVIHYFPFVWYFERIQCVSKAVTLSFALHLGLPGTVKTFNSPFLFSPKVWSLHR